MQIVIDTREQRPYRFQTPAVSGTLPTGDYSLSGAEHLIAIERKSLPDLIACLCSNSRTRFEKELYRAKALDFFAIVIECSLSDIVNGSYRSKMTPKSAIQSLMTFSVRYKLSLFFVENRDYGARITESLLLKYSKEISKRAEAISKPRMAA